MSDSIDKAEKAYRFARGYYASEVVALRIAKKYDPNYVPDEKEMRDD